VHCIRLSSLGNFRISASCLSPVSNFRIYAVGEGRLLRVLLMGSLLVLLHINKAGCVQEGIASRIERSRLCGWNTCTPWTKSYHHMITGSVD
jgi:hypothetical protein